MFVFDCHNDSYLFCMFLEMGKNEEILVDNPDCWDDEFILDNLTFMEMSNLEYFISFTWVVL